MESQKERDLLERQHRQRRADEAEILSWLEETCRLADEQEERQRQKASRKGLKHLAKKQKEMRGRGHGFHTPRQKPKNNLYA